MGSPEFAVPSLRGLVRAHEVVGVVTQPDRASGRGRSLKAPPVKELALELKIPVFQPEKLRAPEAMDVLRAWGPDLIVVAAFGQILRQDVLDIPPHGSINVHASLLPRWRGAAPINATILHGDEETGVTIMKMDAGLDTGPMLAKRAIRLGPEDTAGSVTDALSRLGADLLIETLPSYLNGELTLVPQPTEGMTYAPMLRKEEGRLDFSRPAAELERRVRAFNPWPGAFMDFDGTLLKIHRARVTEPREHAAVGERLIYRDQPAVGTGSGLIVLDEVQPAGKKPMSGRAFLSGARDWAQASSAMK